MGKKDYPRIIEIKEDGRIIAIDKYNKLNTDLNMHTLTNQQQNEVLEAYLSNQNKVIILIDIIMIEIIIEKTIRRRK